MKVMDNNLFTIEPKKGSMEPGECRTVTFTYKHTMAGTDRLPVLLKLARGREILVSTFSMQRDTGEYLYHAERYWGIPLAENRQTSFAFEVS